MTGPTLSDVRRAAASSAATDRSRQSRFDVVRLDGGHWEQLEVPDGATPREGGVIALAYPRDGRVHLLFERRRPDLAKHAGQISFPGGTKEPQDPTLLDTAKRETEEELSIPPSFYEVVGELGRVWIPPTNYLVTPYVAVSEEIPEWRMDPAEVAEVLEVPLSVLLDPGTVEEEEWVLRGKRCRVPFFRVGVERIWGATARMLGMLLEALREA